MASLYFKSTFATMEIRPRAQQVLTPVVKNLLIINGLLFFATFVLYEAMQIYLPQYLALFYFESPYFRVWQLVTAMFMHFDLEHIAFNMFALWLFGTVLEHRLGSKRFLMFYLLAGVGAALFKTGLSYIEYHYFGNYGVLLELGQGASGAVYGLLFAMAYLFPNVEMALLFLPIPIKVKYLVGVLALVGIIGGIGNFNSMPGLVEGTPSVRIGHITHLGGMLAGFVIFKFWKIRYNSG